MARLRGPAVVVSIGGLTDESLAVAVARRLGATGVATEIVGRVGDDARGEALLLALSRSGVGHVAVLRDPARATPSGPIGIPLDAADLALGLGYLHRIDALLLVDPIDAATAAAAETAAAFHGARVVIAAEESQEGVASDVPIVAYRAAHPESVAAAADTIVALLLADETA